MYTWSENPKKDMLQHLEMLTYAKNCQKLLYKKMSSKRDLNKTIINKKANEVSFCIKQGIEFFKNAEDADISISPLLLYYGILSFSKALIITHSSEDIFLDDIKYHGLSTRPITQNQLYQKNKKIHWNLLNEYANTNNGVFLELSKIFDINFDKNSIFKLKDTLSSIPELMQIFDKLSIINSNVIDCYSEVIESNNKITFGIYSTDCYKLEKSCPNIKNNFLKNNMHGIDELIQYTSKKDIKLTDFNDFYNYNAVVGGRYFVLQTAFEFDNKSCKVLLPQLLLDYINFFVLSEQVRYHQDNWNKMLNGENNAIISILKIYVECVKRRFPNFILNHLFEEDFSYGSPAYLN